MTSNSEHNTAYGWVIVTVTFLTLFVVFGIRLSFAVFFVSLIEEFHWPRAQTATIFSTSMFVFAVISPLAGIALDRWGPKRVFSSGATLLAIGLALSSQVNTFWQLNLTYGVVAGLGVTILGLGPQAGLIASWFQEQRGLALGFAFAGTGLGSLVFTPGVERLITHVGWRNAYLILAACSAALVPLMVMFLRTAPHARFSPKVHGQPQRLKQVVTQPAFALILLAALGSVGPLRMLTVHQLAAIVDAGYPRPQAAAIVGMAGAITAVSFVFFGNLSDRVGRQWAYTLGSFCLLGALGMLGSLHYLATWGWPPQVLWGYAILAGMGEGSRSSLVTAVASDLFPGKALGAINGTVGAAFGLGAALFPWLGGALFDRSGDYRLALVVAAAGVLLSTWALWLAPRVARHR